MTRRTAAISAILAAIGLAVLAIPATAQEPENEASEPAVCAEVAEATMRHDGMQAWMTEMSGTMMQGDHARPHDHMSDMMATMHGDGAAHETGAGSMPGPRSMMNPRQMGAGAVMGGPAMSSGVMPGGGS